MKDLLPPKPKPKSNYHCLQHWKRQTRTRTVAPVDSISDRRFLESADQIKPEHQTPEYYKPEEAVLCGSFRSKENSIANEREVNSNIRLQFEKTSSREKSFPNGDFYAGSWHGNLPDGSGKYLWSDGCMYEGEWDMGKQSGKGKISWPSGATYEGDFMCGCMHGIGSYTYMDGTLYKGDWSMNVKHGYGRQWYAGGDVYEGSWKAGIREGYGRYCWENGNNYSGSWKGGVISGKGVLKWATGDTFEGHLLDGLEHGHGVYTWADGSCFIGTWNKGQKDGKGTFFARNRLYSEVGLLVGQACNTQELAVEQESMCTSGRNDYASSFEFGSQQTFSFQRTSSESSSEKSSVDELESASENVIESMVEKVDIERGKLAEATQYIVEREYAQGVLINEIVKECLPNIGSKHTTQAKSWKLNECTRPGETIFKGHQSYDLMVKLQLGIRYTVGKTTPSPIHEITPMDFGHHTRLKFPKMGSALTPQHHSEDFIWSDYCPLVFRHLREMFKIDAADYMLSICGNEAFREFASPGKSGSVFYVSHDARFMIKTLRKSEVKVLLKMLPNYFNHVQTYANTLITKFFGLHQIKSHGGPKVRFVVMGNMFCTELHIHRHYDLKGSWQGRSTDKVKIDENTTLKDLDLDFAFHLEPSWREALVKQIECDCHFLQMEHIVDYSLLLGLHFRAPEHPAVFSPVTTFIPQSEHGNSTLANGGDEDAYFEEIQPDNRALVLVSHSSGPKLTKVGSHVRGSPLKAGGLEGKEVDLLLPGTARLTIQLGVNMPARADRNLQRQDLEERGDKFCGEVYDVVLYLGVIDILQEYDITKRVEHAYKSLRFDPLSISVVEPRLYAKRLQEFIERIFPAS